MFDSTKIWITDGTVEKLQDISDYTVNGCEEGFRRGRLNNFELSDMDVMHYIDTYMTYSMMGAALNMSEAQAAYIMRGPGISSLSEEQLNSLIDFIRTNETVKTQISTGMVKWWNENYKYRYLPYITSGRSSCCGNSMRTEILSKLRGINELSIRDCAENVLLSDLFDCECNRLSRSVCVTKVFEFAAAHHLPEHERKCKFIHGHSYKLEVTVKSPLNDKCFGIDFGTLGSVVKSNVVDVLDHEYLNRYIEVPTSENILLWIWSRIGYLLPGLWSIRLWESSGTFADLTHDDVSSWVKSIPYRLNPDIDEIVMFNVTENIEWTEKLRSYNGG